MKSEELRVKSEKYKFRKFEGITLISLVTTIIVLIILSSVAIYLSLGNSGIFTRAKQAKEVTNKQEATDIINLKITTAQMNKYADEQRMPTLQELADVLCDDNEIQYVTLESKVANIEKITVGDNTSIYTKLSKYPYEFEINSSLQLASINGEKVANVSKNYFEDVILYDGTNIQGNVITLSESAYNFKELLIQVRGRYIQIPIIQGETSIQQGGLGLYSIESPAKVMTVVVANLNEEGTKLTTYAANYSYSDQITNNYTGNIDKIIGRYKIK